MKRFLATLALAATPFFASGQVLTVHDWADYAELTDAQVEATAKAAHIPESDLQRFNEHFSVLFAQLPAEQDATGKALYWEKRDAAFQWARYKKGWEKSWCFKSKVIKTSPQICFDLVTP